jgi:hypothetical protein
MTITVVELRAYVGTDEDSDFIDSCLASGIAMVDRFIGTVTTVPADVVDQAVLMASSELYHRRSAPNGVTQFATMDGSAPVRVARDPLVAITPILLPFVGYAV